MANTFLFCCLSAHLLDVRVYWCDVKKCKREKEKESEEEEEEKKWWSTRDSKAVYNVPFSSITALHLTRQRTLVVLRWSSDGCFDESVLVRPVIRIHVRISFSCCQLTLDENILSSLSFCFLLFRSMFMYHGQARFILRWSARTIKQSSRPPITRPLWVHANR